MCKGKIGLWLIVFILLANLATAYQYAFQITFTDKNNTPYSLTDPLAYLSSRALARRAAQGIAVDSTDLPVNQTYVDSVLTLTGGILHETSRWLNMCMILLPDSAMIEHLAGKSFISNVTLVGYYSTDLHRTAATNSSGSTTPVKKTTNTDSDYYGDTWLQTLMVNGNYLSDNGNKGQGKLIAVLDAGFVGTNTLPGFDSMWFSGRVVDMYDFTFDNTDVFLQDVHGTEVLSTMAGNVPGTFVGAAPYAMYALYVSEYDGNDQPLELDNMLCASERADSEGADVITESLGYDIFDYPPGSGQVFADLDGKTTIGAKAANIATKKGMLFVATAGNDGSPVVPGWGNHILTPGDADSALTIGSVDGSGEPSSFSGYGPNAAGQIKPDVCGMGEGAYAFDASGGYSTPSGTSISTPQIAGWAACLWQANPTATTYQVRQAIIKCANHYSDPGPQFGYGIPNFECTEVALNVKDTPPPFSEANWVIATPNPFAENIKLSVSPDVSQDVHFEVIDMTGKEVANTNEFLYKGYNAPVIIPAAQLPAGIYVLKATSATRQQIIKLEKP